MPFADLTRYPWLIYSFPPMLVGISAGIMGLIGLVRERFSLVGWIFFALSGTAFVWLIGYGFVYSSPDEVTAHFWLKWTHTGISFIPATVFLLTLAMVNRIKQFWAFAVIALLLSAFFVWQTWSTQEFLLGVLKTPWGYFAQYGVFIMPFILFLFGMFIVSLYLYSTEYRRCRPGIQRARMRIFLIAFGIAHIAAVDFLPAFELSVYPFGYLPVFLFILMATWAVVRYRLVDITASLAADQVIASIRDALWVIDREGVFRVVNDVGAQLLKRHKEDLVGRPVSVVVQSFVSMNQVQKWIEFGEMEPFECSFDYRGNPTSVWKVAPSLMYDDHLRPIAILCMAHDVSNQKRALEREKQLVEEKARAQTEHARAMELEKTDQLKTDLLSVFQHEFSTPVTVAKEGIALLEEGVLGAMDPEQKEYLDLVRKNIIRLEGMLKKSLIASKVVANRMTYRYETVDISGLLSQLVEFYKEDANAKQLQLAFSSGASELRCLGDDAYLSYAIEQLLENAIKMAPDNSKVIIEANVSGDQIELILEDEGEGIDEVDIPTFFESFKSTKNVSERSTGGLGLGAFIAHAIIGAHGGDIRIQQVPHGCRFQILLPRISTESI